MTTTGIGAMAGGKESTARLSLPSVDVLAKRIEYAADLVPSVSPKEETKKGGRTKMTYTNEGSDIGYE